MEKAAKFSIFLMPPALFLSQQLAVQFLSFSLKEGNFFLAQLIEFDMDIWVSTAANSIFPNNNIPESLVVKKPDFKWVKLQQQSCNYCKSWSCNGLICLKIYLEKNKIVNRFGAFPVLVNRRKLTFFSDLALKLDIKSKKTTSGMTCTKLFIHRAPDRTVNVLILILFFSVAFLFKKLLGARDQLSIIIYLI